MGSKKNNSPRQNINAQIDYEQLSHAIAKAQIEAEEIREKRKQKERDDADKQFRQTMGEKEYPRNAGKAKKRWFAVRNGWIRFWRLLTLKKKDAIRVHAATSLAQAALSLIFQICEWLLYIAAIVLMCIAFKDSAAWLIITRILYAVFAAIIARLFRLARFEVDQMTDKQYMVALLSAVASFLAMVFALISLLVKRGDS